MQLHTQEHLDLMSAFEKRLKTMPIYFAAEPKRCARDKWPNRQYYENGQLNDYFITFQNGYALAKSIYQ